MNHVAQVHRLVTGTYMQAGKVRFVFEKEINYFILGHGIVPPHLCCNNESTTDK